MDMHVSLASPLELEGLFRLTGEKLNGKVIYQLAYGCNDLPRYIAIDPDTPLTTAGLVPFSALVIICDVGEQAVTCIAQSGVPKGTPLPPTLSCPNHDSYMRPEDFARYKTAPNVLRL